MMKVGLIVPGFQSDESDWCIPALTSLVKTLAQNCRVCVFALRYPNRRDIYEINGAKVFSFRISEIPKIRNAILWTQVFRAILKEHRREPFDVLHAIWANEPGFLGTLIAKSLHIPSIVTCAGGELAALPHISYGGSLSFVQRFLVWVSLQFAQKIIVSSTKLKELCLAKNWSWKNKITIIPLGVDTDLFRQRGTEPQHNFTLINVASLIPVKGHFVLFQTMRKVIDIHPQARLWLVGEGPLRSSLLRLRSRLGLEENIHLAGAINHQELSLYYAQSHAFIITSEYEAQCMALLEAMACALPVIATEVGIAPDIIVNFKNGFCVQKTDVEALSQAIIYLIEHPQERKRMGANNRNLIVKELNLQKKSREVMELYSTITSNCSDAPLKLRR